MRVRMFLSLLALLGMISLASADWKPAPGPLLTRWAKDVKADAPHPEYPRPQLVREQWLNLNGLWEFALQPDGAKPPTNYDGKILVPFPIESALSGVGKRVQRDQRLWYRRTFFVPEKWADQRVLLHFGAVDWATEVWLNGTRLGEHQGGYTPFSFDLTEALRRGKAQELLVAVKDPTDIGPQPRGKQVRNPEGIWYTPTTGIWQTVWLEPVPTANHIQSVKLVPDVDAGGVRVTVQTPSEGSVKLAIATVTQRDQKAEIPPIEVQGKTGKDIFVKVPQPRLWSPETPWLYDLRITLNDSEEVRSYFALRKIALGKDEKGRTRILLNNQFVFQYGPLDQGFWPDGLYTAPTDAALVYDLEVTKRLGFNMVRKHVKVEPARWYTHCDRLGLLVWQDMPSGDAHVAPGRGEIRRSAPSATIYEHELTAMMDAFHNYPCIVIWVPFNEGWGQFETKRITELVKRRDPSRLAICASGWNDFAGVGDIHDIHVYPGPAAPPAEPTRAIVLGEFGGLGLPLKGHTWQDEKNWGYRTFKSREELNEAYLGLMANLRPLIGQGLSAAVYTQTTDVEVEVNGLMTYDRAVLKFDEQAIQLAHRRLYLPPPEITALVPTSQAQGQTWRFTTSAPAEGWQKPGFDDGSWKTGRGGFGTRETPGSVVRTEWNGKEIWLRRECTLPEKLPENLSWLIHHDEDVEVFVNGQSVLKLTGYTTDYVLLSLSQKARSAFRPGRNTIAVHCRQTGGGQYVDLGIMAIKEVDQK